MGREEDGWKAAAGSVCPIPLGPGVEGQVTANLADSVTSVRAPHLSLFSSFCFPAPPPSLCLFICLPLPLSLSYNHLSNSSCLPLAFSLSPTPIFNYSLSLFFNPSNLCMISTNKLPSCQCSCQKAEAQCICHQPPHYSRSAGFSLQ